MGLGPCRGSAALTFALRRERIVFARRGWAATNRETVMLYYFGMVLAAIGATVLISALTYVTTMLGLVIMSMFAFTGAPILDRVFKEK